MGNVHLADRDNSHVHLFLPTQSEWITTAEVANISDSNITSLNGSCIGFGVNECEVEKN